jgi:predicted MFS family arabinose efflux permease
VVAILMTLLGVQEFRPPDSRRIDLPGGAAFAIGLVALIYGLLESSSSGWGSARVIIPLAAALAALASFPLIEHMHSQPMFDVPLLRKPTFVGGLVAALGMYGSLYAILLYLVLYLQNGLHYSALGTGLRLLVITVAAMATAILAGRLSQYVPVRWLIGLGLGLIGLGLLLMRGLHTSVAVLGSIAVAAGALALILIRHKDFHAADPAAPRQGSSVDSAGTTRRSVRRPGVASGSASRRRAGRRPSGAGRRQCRAGRPGRCGRGSRR